MDIEKAKSASLRSSGYMRRENASRSGRMAPIEEETATDRSFFDV